MHRPGSVWRQFTGLSIFYFIVLQSLQELIDGTGGVFSLAEIDVLSVVSDPHILPEGDVLVQLKEDAAGKEEVLDAVERSHWLALELLLDAVGIGEVEDEQVRPRAALVQGHEAHLHGCGLVGGHS